MSALLARSTFARSAAMSRSFHTSRVARSSAKHELVPFRYDSKFGLAFRITAFFVAPFCVPFAVAKWQLSKSTKADD